jgi:hypothetical protein
MKKLRLTLALVAAIALVSSLLASCDFGAATKARTIDECVTGFMSALNSTERSTLYTYLDSASSKYAQAKTAVYWDTLFKVGETYTLSSRTTSVSTLTGSFSSTTTYSGTYSYSLVFEMATDSSGDAVIHSITLKGALLTDSTKTMTINIFE